MVSATQNVQFFTNINGKDVGLASIHEGAGITYFFAADDVQTWAYNSEEASTTTENTGIPQYLALSNNTDNFPYFRLWFVILNKLFGYGDNCNYVKFYAAMETPDPYQNSTKNFTIGGILGGTIDTYSVGNVKNLQEVEIDVKVV
ncbi:hypothetical protein BN1211_5902 [Cyberlindnera jadinii]|uniref:Uncharacterized protein n=1 Tax=Cyberlindnera jadinii (strain ATCC 18201 / CBS 1600 / BCRC 20928 / JCM 3617 / NBRC 0987 / NRRL Y-1542) TaxID=983966 RepID=A0A0H5CA01_CYBJN|nr:hypothetical protein BN1211_5902 [Cyberlindnera jadinii]